jgi:hypothetical protein
MSIANVNAYQGYQPTPTLQPGGANTYQGGQAANVYYNNNAANAPQMQTYGSYPGGQNQMSFSPNGIPNVGAPQAGQQLPTITPPPINPGVPNGGAGAVAQANQVSQMQQQRDQLAQIDTAIQTDAVKERQNVQQQWLATEQGVIGNDINMMQTVESSMETELKTDIKNAGAAA